MGARDAIAKLLVGAAKRTDLPTDAYHGTRRVFDAFKQWPVKEAYTIDRALGTHVAKDPALSSSAFADTGLHPADYNKMTVEAYENINEVPHVIPVKIPAESRFLQADQPIVRPQRNIVNPITGNAVVDVNDPLWRRVRTDTSAIENMAGYEAYTRDPDLLKAALERGRNMPSDEARAVSRALVAGEKATISGAEQDLPYFLRNYGAPVGDDIKQHVTDTARKSWEGKGYAGIRYINTAPMEAGAAGVTDPTSYLVFSPSNIRSRFAQFGGDPESLVSPNLLRGAAFAPVGAGVMGETYDQYKGSMP
jgi:hypothetical protein